MIYFLSWGTLCFFYICNVQRIQGVRIFENVIPAESHMMKYFKPRVVSKTCMLLPDQGPCRGKIDMWHFNPSQQNCTKFLWGGCQGNGNRFDSLSECLGSCISRPGSHKSRPRYCSLTFDYGFCFGSLHRYYYDPRWKVCKSTVYSGCGGNKNNFYNLEQCEQICRFGNNAVTSTSIATAGSRKVLIINPGGTTPARGLVQTTKA